MRPASCRTHMHASATALASSPTEVRPFALAPPVAPPAATAAARPYIIRSLRTGAFLRCVRPSSPRKYFDDRASATMRVRPQTTTSLISILRALSSAADLPSASSSLRSTSNSSTRLLATSLPFLSNACKCTVKQWFSFAFDWKPGESLPSRTNLMSKRFCASRVWKSLRTSACPHAVVSAKSFWHSDATVQPMSSYVSV
mmetsp:Transcript_9866/g.25386  ORF Transcript_9866/g.25386 Transcript_9866/m.25386 type:complete len:200 (-) Transcript_9866:1944-2543(-)